MTDTPLPGAPALPAIPPVPKRGNELSTQPPDESLRGLLREVRAAATNLGAAVAKLETSLLRHELAILTEEHKTNQLREEFARLEEYVRKNVPEAAE